MSNDGEDKPQTLSEYIEESGVLDVKVEELDIDGLVQHSKDLSKLMLESILSELHRQYDEHNINPSPFEQIKSILDMFEDEYKESLRPHLTVVQDEKD